MDEIKKALMEKAQQLQQMIEETENISDTDLVKGLIDYLALSKGAYSTEINEKKKAVEAMKVLALKAGIVKETSDEQKD